MRMRFAGPLLALALLAGLAPAQIMRGTFASIAPENSGKSDQMWSLAASARTEYALPTDFGSGGDVDTWSNGIDIGLVGRFGPTRLSIDFGYEHRQYSFDPEGGMLPPSNRPFDTVHTYSASASVLQPVSQKWAVFVRGGVVMSASHDVAPTEGVNWNALAGAGYRASEKLTVGVGVIALGRFEEDLLIVGGPFVDWRFLPEWRLLFQGPSLDIGWNPESLEDWSFGVRAAFEGRRFRLENGATRQQGIVADRALPVEIYARWQPRQNVLVEGRVGANVWREFEFMNRQGDEIRSFDGDPQLFFGLSVSVLF